MTPQDAFDRYRRILQKLDPDTLDTLGAVVAPGVRFCDPFHDVTGPAAMKQVFSRLFTAADDIDFLITDSAVNDASVYFRWTLKARLRGKPWTIDGVTHATFDPQGRVTQHIEYWDAASQFYERFPFIGPLLRHFRKRIAGS